METNKDKFLKLVSEKDDTFLKDVAHRKKYRKFYNIINWVKFRWLFLKDSFKNIW